MKNIFDGQISRLDMIMKRTSELKKCQQKLLKLKCKEKEEWGKKKQNTQELWNNFKKV